MLAIAAIPGGTLPGVIFEKSITVGWPGGDMLAAAPIDQHPALGLLQRHARLAAALPRAPG